MDKEIDIHEILGGTLFDELLDKIRGGGDDDDHGDRDSDSTSDAEPDIDFLNSGDDDGDDDNSFLVDEPQNFLRDGDVDDDENDFIQLSDEDVGHADNIQVGGGGNNISDLASMIAKKFLF